MNFAEQLEAQRVKDLCCNEGLSRAYAALRAKNAQITDANVIAAFGECAVKHLRCGKTHQVALDAATDELGIAA